MVLGINVGLLGHRLALILEDLPHGRLLTLGFATNISFKGLRCSPDERTLRNQSIRYGGGLTSSRLGLDSNFEVSDKGEP